MSQDEKIQRARLRLFPFFKFREKIELDDESKRVAKIKKETKLWMDTVILPLLEGISESYGEPLLAGIKRLISEKKNPFRPKEGWDKTRQANRVLMEILKQPQTKPLQTIAKRFLKVKMNFIYEKASWLREVVFKEEYPEFYNAIMGAEGGEEWLDEFITDLTNTLKRFLSS